MARRGISCSPRVLFARVWAALITWQGESLSPPSSTPSFQPPSTLALSYTHAYWLTPAATSLNTEGFEGRPEGRSLVTCREPRSGAGTYIGTCLLISDFLQSCLSSALSETVFCSSLSSLTSKRTISRYELSLLQLKPVTARNDDECGVRPLLRLGSRSHLTCSFAHL